MARTKHQSSITSPSILQSCPRDGKHSMEIISLENIPPSQFIHSASSPTNQPTTYLSLLTPPTGSRQKAQPPHGQATARHRRRLSRRHQRTTSTTARSARRGPPSGHQGRQGKEIRVGKQEEAGKGQDCRRGRSRSGRDETSE